MLLWVDDDIAASLESFVDELEEAGYKILIAKTPDEMWRQLDAERKNICGIILDIMLPVGEMFNQQEEQEAQMGIKTGFVLAKKLRKDDRYKNIPLIIFTILNDQDLLSWSKKEDIPLLLKQNTYPFELLREVKKIIEKNKEKDS